MMFGGMNMRFDKLTIKSREAIEQMQKICM